MSCSTDFNKSKMVQSSRITLLMLKVEKSLSVSLTFFVGVVNCKYMICHLLTRLLFRTTAKLSGSCQRG